MQPTSKQLELCGYPGNYSACLIMHIDTVLSIKQRGTDVA